MFTGIIEEIGSVKEFKKNASNALITVECKKVLEDIRLGDSIAINGVCQTVVKFGAVFFTAEISEETLRVTNFSSLKESDSVNLERAIQLSQRLGGHIVSGHVDGVSRVLKIEKNQDFYTVKFEINSELSRYIVKKGSITINGISLTVADILRDNFDVAIIPHTFENTNLKSLETGDYVNIETDILAKYVEKILSTNNNKKEIDENFLKENGFF